MRDGEGLLAVPRVTLLKTVERSFTASYRHLLFFTIEYIDARTRPPQNDKRLYQLPRTANPTGDYKVNLRRDSVLNASPDAVSIAVAEPVKAQDWESHKASTLHTEAF